MFKKVFNRENVFQYRVVSNSTQILICNKAKFIESFDLGNFDLRWLNDEFYELGSFIYNGFIKVFNDSSDGEFLNTNDGTINQNIKLKFDKKVLYKYSSHLVIFRNKQYTPPKEGLYDLRKDIILWEVNSIYDVTGISEKGIYARGDKMASVEFYSLNDGSLLWQFSVSEIGKYTRSDGIKTYKEEGKVEKIIGVFAEVLVVVITGGGERVRGNTQLIGLDTNTGKLLWQIDQFEGTPNRQLPATATLMPDAQNKSLIGFQSGDFIEIDPQAGKVLRYSHINLVYEQYTLLPLMDSFSLQGDHLYFRTSVSSMGGFPTAIGGFNYKTETIEWLHVFEEFAKEGKFIPINQPKAEGNRVYALDSGNTLHIFEREQ